MKRLICRGWIAALISCTIGCQLASPPPASHPLEKIQTDGFRHFEQELQQKTKKLSPSLKLQVLAAGTSPVLSPDGRHIAFEGRGSTGGYHIWMMDINGGNLRELSHFGWDMSPQWSPDSQKIIFQSYGPKNHLDPRNLWGDPRDFSIWVVDVNGKNAKQFTPRHSETDQYPSWSPDGQHVVWTRGNKLWIADSKGQNPHPIKKSTGGYPTVSRWSVDLSLIHI